MKFNMRLFFLFVAIIIVLSACEDKSFTEYYGTHELIEVGSYPDYPNSFHIQYDSSLYNPWLPADTAFYDLNYDGKIDVKIVHNYERVQGGVNKGFSAFLLSDGASVLALSKTYRLVTYKSFGKNRTVNYDSSKTYPPNATYDNYTLDLVKVTKKGMQLEYPGYYQSGQITFFEYDYSKYPNQWNTLYFGLPWAIADQYALIRLETRIGTYLGWLKIIRYGNRRLIGESYIYLHDTNIMITE